MRLARDHEREASSDQYGSGDTGGHLLAGLCDDWEACMQRLAHRAVPVEGGRVEKHIRHRLCRQVHLYRGRALKEA